MADLTTNYVGLRLRSPLIVGSAGITETVERMKRAQDNGAGAVVMKSLFEEEVSHISPTPRFRLIHRSTGDRETFSLYSYEQGSEWGLERYAKEVSRAKKELEIPVIPSINCITEKGWVSYAKRLEEAGADALELNFSCPHGSITFRGGKVEDEIIRIVEKIRKSVSLPLIAKLSPQLTFPLKVVEEIESLGINGVTIFNRLAGLDIDINEEKPIMHEGYAGHGGPWAIYYPLRWISEISRRVKIDISGSGGVYSAEDAVKYLLAGATTVQMVTAIFLNGYEIIKKVSEELREYMDRKGYKRIKDFRGKICSKIKGTYQIKRTHYLKAKINDNLISPCQSACPAKINIQAYVNLISEGKFEEAFNLIREKVPFPFSLSRVCPAPCERECIRGKIDESIAINDLKRFLADWAIENTSIQRLKKKVLLDGSGDKVAIIGAGPAGLSCAYDLAKRGYKPCVFESQSVAGGMLMMGIPSYRLPKEIVEKEIREIQNFGVEIKLKTSIGKDLAFKKLKSLGYKAIFIATGAHKDKRLNIPGENLRGVISGFFFLKSLNSGKKIKIDKKVAVIGGGNTAVDSARSSIRLGAEEVYLIYRRTKEEMPAIFEELRQAEEEGVKVLYLTTPVEIIEKNGRVGELRCIPLVLGEKDKDGRRKPSPIPASSFSLKVDTIIVAIGQVPDLSFLNEAKDFKIKKDNTLFVNPKTLATNIEGVFAGGDVVSGPATVIQAIAAGKRAALSIDRYLRGEPFLEEEEIVVSREKALSKRGIIEEKRREKPFLISLDMRKTTFKEVKKTLTREQAIKEAKRCFSCGCGLGCGICERVCIYSAIKRVGGNYKVDNEKCDGCGLCVEVCPKDNIELVSTW